MDVQTWTVFLKSFQLPPPPFNTQHQTKMTKASQPALVLSYVQMSRHQAHVPNPKWTSNPQERTGTYGTVFDERVAQLRHFVSGHGNLLQEQLPSLFHHFLTAGQVLTESDTRSAEIPLHGANRLQNTAPIKKLSCKVNSILLIAWQAKNWVMGHQQVSRYVADWKSSSLNIFSPNIISSEQKCIVFTGFKEKKTDLWIF